MSASSSPKRKQGENSAFSGTLVSRPLIPARRVQLSCTAAVLLATCPSVMARDKADAPTVDDEPPLEHSFLPAHYARRGGSQAEGKGSPTRDRMLSQVIAIKDFLAA